MKHKCMVTYEYPVEHKPPVLAEIYLHGGKVQTRDIKPIYVNPAIEELEKIKRKLILKLSKRFDFGITEALNIIDEELSELKGE